MSSDPNGTPAEFGPPTDPELWLSFRYDFYPWDYPCPEEKDDQVRAIIIHHVHTSKEAAQRFVVNCNISDDWFVQRVQPRDNTIWKLDVDCKNKWIALTE